MRLVSVQAAMREVAVSALVEKTKTDRGLCPGGSWAPSDERCAWYERRSTWNPPANTCERAPGWLWMQWGKWRESMERCWENYEMDSLPEGTETKLSTAWRAGYAEGRADAACTETCGNVLRQMVEIGHRLIKAGIIDHDRTAAEREFVAMFAGAVSYVPCENCDVAAKELAEWEARNP